MVRIRSDKRIVKLTSVFIACADLVLNIASAESVVSREISKDFHRRSILRLEQT